MLCLEKGWVINGQRQATNDFSTPPPHRPLDVVNRQMIVTSQAKNDTPPPPPSSSPMPSAKVHASLASLVSGIMSIDLLRQRDRWKTHWAQIRYVPHDLYNVCGCMWFHNICPGRQPTPFDTGGCTMEDLVGHIEERSRSQLYYFFPP